MALEIDDFPSTLPLLGRGLTRRCPWCGDRRAYFTGWFSRQESCHNCRHGYRRGDHAFELGALTANIMLTFIAVLAAMAVIVVVTLPSLPIVTLTVVTATIALVAPVLFYTVSFTLWQAIDLWMRPPTADELAGRGDARL